MNPKSILFYVVLAIWVIGAISCYTYVTGLKCTDFIVTRYQNGTTVGLCDTGILTAYQKSIDYCADLPLLNRS
jgi:hypothetical protein